MGYDYDIHYRSGQVNQASDALSRVQGSEMLLMAISVITSNLEQHIKLSYHLDKILVSIIEELQDLP